MSAKLLDGRLVDWMGEDMNGFLVGLADGQING